MTPKSREVKKKLLLPNYPAPFPGEAEDIFSFIPPSPHIRVNI
jgi:hypothetical protein